MCNKDFPRERQEGLALARLMWQVGLTMKQAALISAIDRAGGEKAVAAKLGISRQAVEQWENCPPYRVLELERLSGIPRHELRPDLYPPPAEQEVA